MIDVELNGRHFQEMHVDGGAARLLDPEPGDVEGRQEEEGQQGCGQEAADDRIGHRPQETSEAIGIMRSKASSAATASHPRIASLPATNAGYSASEHCERSYIAARD